ncbi:MAG TPA: hypothetical protein ENK57_22310 [Polyangiaceae bacterium]|nr:hypothetical protein [Polyangiaceae bacterium]
MREHRRLLDGQLDQLRKQRFRSVFHLHGVEEVESASVQIVRRECDRRTDRGPFDLIGDVHGCAAELRELLERLGYSADGRHPDGRRVVFLGDLVDRGPAIPETLEIAMNLVCARGGIAVLGNHDAKLLRWFAGKNVKLVHGLEQSVEQLEGCSAADLHRYRLFLESLGVHYLLDGGRLVIAHGGLAQRFHGRTSGAVRAFCLFGDTTGETDEDGYPIRLDWGSEYRGEAAVVYGHTPTLEPAWVNNALCIDTGCVFGGSLTALRWPERTIVSVPAREIYCDHG